MKLSDVLAVILVIFVSVASLVSCGDMSKGEQKNYDSGYDEGYLIGREEGYNEGYHEGYDLGYTAALGDYLEQTDPVEESETELYEDIEADIEE